MLEMKKNLICNTQIYGNTLTIEFGRVFFKAYYPAIEDSSRSIMSHFFPIFMIFRVTTPYDSSFVYGQYVWTFSCSISTEGA